jgi:PAS domain S-box-containing protein
VNARVLVGLWNIALLLAVGAAALVFTSDHETEPWPTAGLSIATALAFVGAGLIAWARRPDNRIGVLLVVVGLTWFVGALGESNHALPYTIGIALDSLPFIFFAWLALAYPTGRLQTALDRVLVALAAVLALLAQPAYFLFNDQRDVCANCPSNLLLVSRHEGLAAAIEVVFNGIAVALLAAGIAVLARRWLRATPALRRVLTPVVGTATLALGVVAVMLVSELFVDRLSPVFDWVLLACLLAVPLAFLYGLLLTRLARAEVGRLLLEVPEAAEPEQVQDALRRALGDPTLRLALWVGHARRHVDVEGKDVELLPDTAGRVTTRIEYEGRPLAAIEHDAALLREPELLDEVVAAARLGLEKDRGLRALRRVEMRQRALLDAIPDLMFRIGRDGTYLDYRADSDGDLLTAADQVVGRTVRERLPAVLAEMIMAAIERALAGGGVQTVEYELEMRGALRYYEGRIAEAGPDEALLIVREITDRKRAEAALRADRDFLRTVTDTIPSLLCVIDLDGRIVRFNRAVERTTGWASEDRQGLMIWEAFEEPEEVRARIAESGVEHENTMLARAGEPRRVAWWSVPVVDEDGENRFLLCGVDITQRKQHEREIHASRQRIMEIESSERRRLERNLHDGAQQRLVALSLSLRLARAKIDKAPGEARELLEGAEKELFHALEELRELARGIHPAVLSDRGLEPALEMLAQRSPIPVDVEGPGERLAPRIEAAAYFVVSEALANVVKYADATSASVSVRRLNGRVLVHVDDDGVGGADPARGSGLRGLADRLSALDGKLEVESPAGGGTRIRAEIPCASGTPAGSAP